MDHTLGLLEQVGGPVAGQPGTHMAGDGLSWRLGPCLGGGTALLQRGYTREQGEDLLQMARHVGKGIGASQDGH